MKWAVIEIYDHKKKYITSLVLKGDWVSVVYYTNGLYMVGLRCRPEKYKLG